MKHLLLIFLGGGAGSVCRFLLSSFIDKLHVFRFPLGTLTVNLIACFLIGTIIAWLEPRATDVSPAIRMMLVVGFLGGFSTFSAFTNDTLNLFNNQLSMNAATYVLFSVLCGLFANLSGYLLVQRLISVN
jgi:fluoride exporter